MASTAVKPGIYGLAFTMGKWFLTDNSAMVGRILMISSADPHEILILMKWWKNQPSTTSASGFWPIFAQKCCGFCDGKFFPVMRNTSNVQGSISTARATFEPKTHASSHLLPHFLAQYVFLSVQKYPKKSFFRIFVKRPIKPLGKISEPKKQIAKFFFPLGATRAWSSNLCAAEFPHYNSDPVKQA